MSSPRQTWVALGVAAVLGLVYWGWIKEWRPRREKSREDAKLIFPGTDSAGLAEILLRKKGSDDVLLSKVNGQWRLVKPIDAPADDSAVSALVAGLAGAKREEIVVEKDADLRDFGLDQPSGGVTFKPTSPGAKPLALFFGLDSPSGSQAYGMVDGLPQVFLTGMVVKTAALKDADALRDKTVWKVDREQVASVAGPGLRLESGADGWTVGVTAASEPAKASKVDEWLDQLDRLRADKVPSETGKGSFGLNGGKKLAITFKDGSTRVLRRGAKAKPSGFYVGVEGQAPVYLLPDSAAAVLDRKPQDLADRDVAALLPASVVRFEVSGPGGKLVAAKKLGTWAWEGRAIPAGEKAFDFGGFVDRIAGAQLLQRLPKSARPAKPQRSISFFADNGSLVELVELGPVQGQGQVFYSGNKGQACVAASNLLDGLPPLEPPAPAANGPAAPVAVSAAAH